MRAIMTKSARSQERRTLRGRSPRSCLGRRSPVPAGRAAHPGCRRRPARRGHTGPRCPNLRAVRRPRRSRGARRRRGARVARWSRTRTVRPNATANTPAGHTAISHSTEFLSELDQASGSALGWRRGQERRFASWARSSCCTSLAGTSRGSLPVRVASAAQTPAA